VSATQAWIDSLGRIAYNLTQWADPGFAQLLLIRFFPFSVQLPAWPGHASGEPAPLRQCHLLMFYARLSR
jgi:hypothetical protein